MESYLTVRHQSEFTLIEKKSEFIGVCAPVSTEEEAVAFVNSVKKKHSAARHNVYAYILRQGNTARFSDDGEPHGTAGMPVLDSMRKSGITDAAVVVTRYFGGILLGTGGLVRAYTAAATGAVREAEVARMEVFSLLSLRVNYSDYQKLQPIMSAFSARIADSEFGDDVQVTVRLLSERANGFSDEVFSATKGKTKPIFLREMCDFSDK